MFEELPTLEQASGSRQDGLAAAAEAAWRIRGKSVLAIEI
jgi:hypothetical protein